MSVFSRLKRGRDGSLSVLMASYILRKLVMTENLPTSHLAASTRSSCFQTSLSIAVPLSQYLRGCDLAVNSSTYDRGALLSRPPPRAQHVTCTTMHCSSRPNALLLFSPCLVFDPRTTTRCMHTMILFFRNYLSRDLKNVPKIA